MRWCRVSAVQRRYREMGARLLSEVRIKGGETMDELKPCPFCGSTEAVGYTGCKEVEACDNCLDCGYTPSLGDCVVCNVKKGGCGASSGFATSKEEAAEKWNRRS